MPHQPDRAAPVTPDELRALLRLAGLEVSEDRAPAVLAELEAQRRYARMLDDVLTGVEAPSFAPYDPAFPPVKLEGDQA